MKKNILILILVAVIVGTTFVILRKFFSAGEPVDNKREIGQDFIDLPIMQPGEDSRTPGVPEPMDSDSENDSEPSIQPIIFSIDSEEDVSVPEQFPATATDTDKVNVSPNRKPAPVIGINGETAGPGNVIVP